MWIILYYCLSLLQFYNAVFFHQMSLSDFVELSVVDLFRNPHKLVFQDTAGQERFRTLTPSYYRGAQGVILGQCFCIIDSIIYYMTLIGQSRVLQAILSIYVFFWLVQNNVQYRKTSISFRYLLSKPHQLLNVKLTLFSLLLVYDVTRRDTFTKLENWLNELETYCTRNDLVKMLVGNKIDKVCLFNILNVNLLDTMF